MGKFENKDKKKNPKAASEKAGQKNENQLSVRLFCPSSSTQGKSLREG